MKKLINQQGIVHILPLLLIIAAVGIISFLLISSTAPIGGLFGVLNPKSKSHAASNSITVPLKVSATNSHYFVDGNGKAVYLAGTHTWNTFQDLSQSTSPAAFDFNAYVTFLKAHGHNATILWKKDLPTYCNWGAGGTWHIAQFPWMRAGPGTASDGLPKFNLSMFDQSYFDRLRTRVLQLQQNNIYAIVQLFDGLQLVNNRCSNDGYPFTGANNVNAVDDGGGVGSMTMTSANTMTNFEDAYVQKVVDTVFDQPNVILEISEEAPGGSDSWWSGHMINLIHSYENSKAGAGYLKHPVLYPTTNQGDLGIFSSQAETVATGARISPSNNQGKVLINDSDHSYFGMWNDSAQTNRNYIWQNFTNGSSVIFMDPYTILWTSGNRNLCLNPVNGVCSAEDHRWDNFRDNLGAAVTYGNKMNLIAMTPNGNLSSTGNVLANTAATGSEFLVYAPNGGSFAVNLSNTTRNFNVEWYNPSSNTFIPSGTVVGGSSSKSFTPPFGGDAVLYLVDSGTAGTPPPTAVPTPTPIPTATPVPTASPSPTPGPVESAFNGPHNLPGTLQAEDYDNGGEGLAYHDTDTTNNGGAYRTTEGVDVQATSDTGGGFNVGWFIAGEWMKYMVNVASSGTYTISARVASQGVGGTFHVEVDGVDKTGPMNVPDTTNWQTFTTVTKSGVSLTSGAHIIRVVGDINGSTGSSGGIGNINYLSFAQSATPTPLPTASPTPTSTPNPVICPKGPLGDIDCDGTIGIFDYNILVTNFGKSGIGIPGDLDNSGKVDLFDYNIIVTNYGK